jgi:hypothetical protein
MHVASRSLSPAVAAMTRSDGGSAEAALLPQHWRIARGREWPRALHAKRWAMGLPRLDTRSRATIPSANFPCAACCGRRDMSQSPLATRNTPALVAHVSTAAEQVCAAEMLDEKPTSVYQRNTE